MSVHQLRPKADEFCPECGQPVPPLDADAGPGKARKQDPPTAKLAAKLAWPRAGVARYKLMLALLDRPKGASAEQLAFVTRLPYVSVSTRLTELRDDGWVRPTGATVVTRAGRPAAVVALTWRARRKLRRQLDKTAA